MKTQITFVLDSSGSMEAIEQDTKGGFNSLLEEQQDEEGIATVTLYEFNSDVEQLYQAKRVEDAPKLTSENYTPGGNTALHDAIVTAVKQTGKRIESLSDSEQPDHVLFVVLTDGKENASETPRDTVRELIELRQEENDWEFLFIGANQDAVITAEKMGMNDDRALNMAHNAEGARAAYESTSDQIRQAREKGHTDGYREEDRRRQEEATDN